MPTGTAFIVFIFFLISVGGLIAFCTYVFGYRIKKNAAERNKDDSDYNYYVMKRNKRYNLILLAIVTVIAFTGYIGYLFYYTKVSDALTPDNGVSKIYLIEKSGCSDCINAELNGDIDYAKSLMTKLYESNSIDSIVYIENVSSKDDLVQVGYFNDTHIPVANLSYEKYLKYTSVAWVPSIVVVNSDGQTLELDWNEETGWPDDMSAKILNFL